MTVCVVTICDDRKTIVLVADKMIGTGFIESEPEINKLLELHKDWWVLFAGDDISPVFDIIDYAKESIHKQKEKEGLSHNAPVSLKIAMEAVRVAYEKKRMEQAIALYLTPIGWTLEAFNSDGTSKLSDFGEIKAKISEYFLNIELLVTGFDAGTASLFSLSGREGALINRHDIPGFFSIGSGGIGAIYMLYYREMSYKKPVREAVYYAMEAKLFGEQASGVGEKTDLHVATSDGKFIPFGEDTIDKKLVVVWNKLRPHWIGKESREVLNSLPELEGFASIKKKAKEPEEKKTEENII